MLVEPDMNLLRLPLENTFFESVADTSVRAKFTVVDADLLSVNPQKLEWESDDTSEKTFTITTYSNQMWKIEEV